MLGYLISKARGFGLEVHEDKTKILWNGIGKKERTMEWGGKDEILGKGMARPSRSEEARTMIYRLPGERFRGSTRPLMENASAKSRVRALVGQLEDNNREIEMQRIEIKRLRLKRKRSKSQEETSTAPVHTLSGSPGLCRLF